MNFSTDTDFISGALELVTGERIVSLGKDGGAAAGSFDLDSLHKRSLQWRGEEEPSLSPDTKIGDAEKAVEIWIKTPSII